MKKITSAILFISMFNSSFSQPYKEQLKKVNDFLKTFDNGYYGYLEIKDGYLYDRFASGKYSRSEIKYLGKAYVADAGKKVSVDCIDGKDCVFSTYTDSYHKSIGFSQTSSFNTSELTTLLDNLITACKKNDGININEADKNIDPDSEKRRLESLKSNIDMTGNGSLSVKNNSSANYQSALKKLNDYLKTFDNGYYGYFEVKNGYIYDRFKAGKYNKFKMEDMEGAVIQEQYSRVIFKCKGDNKCISTDWKENGKEEYSQFVSGSSYNYQELAILLNNFRDAYLGNNQTSTNSSTESITYGRDQKAKERQKINSSKTNGDEDDDWGALESSAVSLKNSIKESLTASATNKKYQIPLQKLNDYLKTYNAETYRDIEVKDGKVYFAFFVYGGKYNSSIDINELKNNTIVTIGKSVGSSVVDEVKISCKGGSKCFYSTYSNGNADHFRFFSHTVKDFTRMEQLITDFIKSL